MLENQKKKDKASRVEKPWGYELIWAHTSQYVGKILIVRGGESLSLQYHQQKEETLFIESGECEIFTGPTAHQLHPVALGPGGIFHITPGTLHQIKALTDCRIFEVSTPELSDVVRLKDSYGRV